MKYRQATWFYALVLLAVLSIPNKLFAQKEATAEPHNPKRSHYRVIDVGTLGGPTSGFTFGARIINRRGALVGGADTSVFDPICGCYNFHAFKWQRGILTDLGTLPGGDSFSFGIAINSQGTVVGISNNGLIDPVTGAPVFEAVTWKDSNIINLGTFGGSFSLPNDINSRGQAAGGAENTTPDPDNLGGALIGLPSPTQYRAALWQKGEIRDLGTLGDGPDSFALFINERGQVGGMSYTSSVPDPITGIPPIHAFLWEHSQMIDIPSLGGASTGVSGLNIKGQVIGTSSLTGETVRHPFIWQGGVLTDIGTFGGDNGSASWLNDAGQVVGGADLEGSQTHHAFLWEKGVLKDLGTVGTDPCSRADSINSRGQVVGESASVCGTSNSAAFLLENGGPMIDLNSFVSPDSGIRLNDAAFINERGEIAVEGSLSGDAHAFVLVPDGDCDDDCERRITANQINVTPIQNPVTTKSGIYSPVNRGIQLRNRLMNRYHAVGQQQAPSD